MKWQFDFRSFLLGLLLAGAGTVFAVVPVAPPAERPGDAKPACECPEVVCPEWDCPTCPAWPGCEAAGCWEE